MNDKYLPIGTVVKLNGTDKKFFIIGYGATDPSKPGERYDYIGYTYPEGFIKKEKNYVFNSDDIKLIYYNGYKDKKYKEMLEVVAKKEKKQ